MADDSGPNESEPGDDLPRLVDAIIEGALRDGAFINVGVDLARERTEQVRRAVDERLDNYARRGWPDAQPQPNLRGEARLEIDSVQRAIRTGHISVDVDRGWQMAVMARLHHPDVDCDPYPELTKALNRWHANDDQSDPARVFTSWRNYGGGRGRGWDVELAWTHDNLWTWDSWTAALVVLAGIDDRAVGVRRCPDCRGRGLVFRWFASIDDGLDDGLDAYPMHDHDREWSPAGGLGEVLYVSRESGRACIGLQCGECRGAKSVDVRLLELVFFAAQGWPWALEHGGVIADQLQAAGDPWGLWLAALLEPRVWGGWVAYPTRRAVAGDIVQRLDAELERRSQRALAARLVGPGSTVVVRVDGPVFPGQSVYVNPSNPGVFSCAAPGAREGSFRAGTVVGVVSDGLATLAPAHGVAVNSAGEAMLVKPRPELTAGYTALGLDGHTIASRLADIVRPTTLARAAMARYGVTAYPDTMPAGWSEYRPTSERFSEADQAFAEVLAGEPITLTFHDDMPHVVTTETVRRDLERIASERPEDPDASERPHSPPIGRGLSRRLERGRRR